MTHALKNNMAEVVAYWQRRLEEVRAFKELHGGAARFTIYNTAHSAEANNSKSDIFYFDAVSEGRVAITAMENRINAFEKLHYKVSDTRWIITPSVGPSAPLRIRDAAQEWLARALNQAVAANWPPGQPPTYDDLVRMYAEIKAECVQVYQRVTRAHTATYNVAEEFYARPHSPLSDSFFALDRGERPEVS